MSFRDCAADWDVCDHRPRCPWLHVRRVNQEGLRPAGTAAPSLRSELSTSPTWTFLRRPIFCAVIFFSAVRVTPIWGPVSSAEGHGSVTLVLPLGPSGQSLRSYRSALAPKRTYPRLVRHSTSRRCFDVPQAEALRHRTTRSRPHWLINNIGHPESVPSSSDHFHQRTRLLRLHNRATKHGWV